MRPGIAKVALYPGPSHILSHSHGEKSGEGLGSKLRHRPEMVDSVDPSPPFPVCDVVLILGLLHSCPRPFPDFSPRLRDKIWEGPGDEAIGKVGFAQSVTVACSFIQGDIPLIVHVRYRVNS